MYNDFVIVGPEKDPAGIKGMTDAKEAFKKIAQAQAGFVSRETLRVPIKRIKKLGKNRDKTGRKMVCGSRPGMGRVRLWRMKSRPTLYQTGERTWPMEEKSD